MISCASHAPNTAESWILVYLMGSDSASADGPTEAFRARPKVSPFI